MTGKNSKGLVVVTGCDTGIGKSLVEILIKEGYTLAISYLKENPFIEDAGVYAKKMDIRIPLEVKEFCDFVKKIIKEKVKFEALVNNAGIALGGPVENTPIELYREIFEVNFFGVVTITQALIPNIIRNKGKIIVVGSFAGKIAMPFFSAYASSKFALEGFCDSLRREMEPFGVKTVLFEPAAVATPIWNKGITQDVSFIDDKYLNCFYSAREGFVKGGNEGMASEKAAALIAKVLCSNNPRARYLISGNKIKTKLLTLVPGALLDIGIKKLFNLNYSAENIATQKVSAVECNSYELEEVYLSVKEALNRIGFVIPKGKKVLLKPNVMSQNKPEQHTITNYSIIDALCRILKENDCSIQIAESEAFYQRGLTREAFEISKVKETAEKYCAELIPLEEEPLILINSGLVGLKELYIPKVLLEADMVFNVCKLKTHGSLRLSGAIKNMFGCLPGGYKQKIHMWTKNNFELSEVFIDIHKAVKPSLSIMDAVISLDGGPSAIGRHVKTSRILASTNAAALDVAACKILGYDPTDISTLICAKERKMIHDYEDIEVLGELKPFKFKNIKKGIIETEKTKDGFFVTDTYVLPVIKDSRCNKCNKCVSICALGAIQLKDEKFEIDNDKCILCYRCLGVCPENAIKIKSSLLNKFIRVVRGLTKI